jgi:hypothetical protein
VLGQFLHTPRLKEVSWSPNAIFRSIVVKAMEPLASGHSDYAYGTVFPLIIHALQCLPYGGKARAFVCTIKVALLYGSLIGP